MEVTDNLKNNNNNFTVLTVQPVLLEVSPSTDCLTIPLPSGNTWENLFRNWRGLSQVL